MKVIKTSLEGVLIIEPAVFRDNRGFFMGFYHQRMYKQSGVEPIFVQDNIAYSVRGTLRGLHYQHPHEQAKLVQAVKGEVFDVAVDVRRGSPTFGQWVGTSISEENRRQFYIPEGFAHGLCVVSKTALVIYKCSDMYAPDSEGGVLWSDPDLGIEWPVKTPMLSKKDGKYACLKDISPDNLPLYGNHLTQRGE